MRTKEAPDYLRRLWFVKLAEMAFQKRVEIEQQKTFKKSVFALLTTKGKSYTNGDVNFLTTTTKDDYISDITGNRRFLLIKTTKIDVQTIKNDRNIIWGAAYQAFKQNEKYWLKENLLGFAETEKKA